MEPIETLQYKNHKISIYPDECGESPRNWDNIAEIHCAHRRYSLGDKGFNYQAGADCITAVQEAKIQGDVVLPLYLYDHSDITISLTPFNDRWDSGQVGYVIVRRGKMLKEFGAKKFTKAMKARALKIAEGEVQTYDQYLRGDIYGYRVDEHDDSCWGFYGMEECLEEAKSTVDWMVRQEVKKHCERVKQWILNKVPLIYRVVHA